MFTLVVLSAVLAVAVSAPAPGLLGGYALPAATSYSSRIDVHSKPLITTYAAPVLAKTVVEAPLSYAYPAVSHASYGVHAAPLVTGYAVGHDDGLGLGYGYGGYGGYGIGHGGYGIGHGYGYGHGW